MHLIISPAGRGRFHAHLGDRLITTSETPFYSSARILQAEGVLPQEPLTMSHAGSNVIALRSTVGQAALLTVQDNDHGLRTRRYAPSPFARTA